ncbi:hypothetical protein MPTK1_2g20690 [Marchantia polymorpha subsp. ruderalis]|uniref:Uncharacterized protein n=1 Tax=Marchantia polymorpha TaxID=3197 RepID=A0A2R6W0Z9_MARPO|nr:hypothetical protein MARPO_0195s0001 [Marchantia polymorpha]BBN03095.1 hypothetical protein Mp_2g20690 [Marchantia polymorpha subsp. ruderalis]|eukprot:PTQ27508.1 hypothetical protein MARPO_0195s0001 [Marchantia polymorpha]
MAESTAGHITRFRSSESLHTAAAAICRLAGWLAEWPKGLTRTFLAADLPQAGLELALSVWLSGCLFLLPPSLICSFQGHLDRIGIPHRSAPSIVFIESEQWPWRLKFTIFSINLRVQHVAGLGLDWIGIGIEIFKSRHNLE